MDFLKDDYVEEKLRPLKVEFSPYISKKLQEIAKTMGISEREALKQLVGDNRRLWKKPKLDSRSWEKTLRESNTERTLGGIHSSAHEQFAIVISSNIHFRAG